MRRSLMVPAVILGFSACWVGPKASKFAPANAPQGIEADLRLSNERMRVQVKGELLEVQDTGLVVLSADRVVYVPLGAIDAGWFRRGGILIAEGEFASGKEAWLRSVSRFPAGMSPEIRARLLAAYGQTEPDIKP